MSRKGFGFANLGILCGAIVSFTADSALGQRVFVGRGGGVSVRAPFVRVDVYPYGGGVSVRAPFAAVDVPGRGYYYGPPPGVVESRTVEPVFPTADELAAMDDERLQQTLRSNADRLHERLRRFNTGDTWQRYLRLTKEALDDFSAGREDRRDALVKLLDRFQFVRSQPQYGMIAELPAFAAMQAAVTESVLRLEATPADGSAPHEELPMPPPDPG